MKESFNPPPSPPPPPPTPTMDSVTTTGSMPVLDYGFPAVTMQRIRGYGGETAKKRGEETKKANKRKKMKSFSEMLIGESSDSIIPDGAEELSTNVHSGINSKLNFEGEDCLDPVDPYALISPKVALTAPNATPTPLAIYSEKDMPSIVEPDTEDDSAIGMFTDEDDSGYEWRE